MDKEPKFFSASDTASWIDQFRQSNSGLNFGDFITNEVYQAFKDRIPESGLSMDNIGAWAKEVGESYIRSKREKGLNAPYVEEFSEAIKRFMYEKMYELDR